MKRADVMMAESLLARGNDRSVVAQVLGVSDEVLRHCLELARDRHPWLAPKPRAPTDEDRQAAEAYQAGQSMLEVARDFGHSLAWVRRALSRTGTPSRPRGIAKKTERDAEIVRRFDAGETGKVIADDLGISRERVRQVLVRAGRKRSLAQTAEMLRERRDAAIKADYEASLTYPEIAAKHGVSCKAVSGALRRQGIAPVKPPKVSLRTREALRMFDEGATIADITQKLGYKDKSVCTSALHRYGRTLQRRAMWANGAAA